MENNERFDRVYRATSLKELADALNAIDPPILEDNINLQALPTFGAMDTSLLEATVYNPDNDIWTWGRIWSWDDTHAVIVDESGCFLVVTHDELRD
jgi:hypothetical protein